ncbi:RNA polymerase sigma factor [Paraglaciecola arctica]|uniref:RNA polymerase sigma factor n=1 Tax=Paraglaciecola arctica TaxID=1128911 RepID=UPI001C079919|nr:RNA polymerase sigma factor [Paraglaciecola arctica]MBU3001892.1 RNA polymerase sigma factor [Paraglaciecola arctica]
MKRDSEHILTEWLVVNCQLGNANALEQLMKIWYPKLLRYAYRQLGDQQKAQDAVQNTFEVVSKTIRKIQDPSCFAKWVYQILQNKGVDIIRQKQRQDRLCDEYVQFQELHYASNLTVVAGSEKMEFDQMLDGLPPQLYQLVHLHYLEGFSMLEISKMLALPTGTIKSRLHQARKSIQNKLHNSESGEVR